MSMSLPDPNDITPPALPDDEPAEVVDIFTETARRMAERQLTLPGEPAPAEAIRALKGGSNPVERYLANRAARPETMRNYEKKLKRTMALLVEAGFETGAGIASAREFPWHRITVTDADSFVRLVTRHYTSAKSRENYVGVVRSMLRQCARVELIDRRTCDGLLDASGPCRKDHSRRQRVERRRAARAPTGCFAAPTAGTRSEERRCPRRVPVHRVPRLRGGRSRHLRLPPR